MVQKTVKRRVGRGVTAPNKTEVTELADGKINMQFSLDLFMRARSVVLAKTPMLKTNPEILNAILEDYFKLHQVQVTLDARKIA